MILRGSRGSISYLHQTPAHFHKCQHWCFFWYTNPYIKKNIGILGTEISEYNVTVSFPNIVTHVQNESYNKKQMMHIRSLPSTKLTYPTWVKGKSSTQKWLGGGICFFCQEGKPCGNCKLKTTHPPSSARHLERKVSMFWDSKVSTCIKFDPMWLRSICLWVVKNVIYKN